MDVDVSVRYLHENFKYNLCNKKINHLPINLNALYFFSKKNLFENLIYLRVYYFFCSRLNIMA